MLLTISVHPALGEAACRYRSRGESAQVRVSKIGSGVQQDLQSGSDAERLEDEPTGMCWKLSARLVSIEWPLNLVIKIRRQVFSPPSVCALSFYFLHVFFALFADDIAIPIARSPPVRHRLQHRSFERSYQPWNLTCYIPASTWIKWLRNMHHGYHAGLKISDIVAIMVSRRGRF